MKKSKAYVHFVGLYQEEIAKMQDVQLITEGKDSRALDRVFLIALLISYSAFLYFLLGVITG
ncbi:MAG: hypothetical protein Q8P30_04765 [Candidatus Uhrbacteria bacterium]|nr:hypothetical protein [Candidatus Uhrbacteria bacterium]